jgi:aromatic ring-opening dioxygenase LigB subunit
MTWTIFKKIKNKHKPLYIGAVYTLHFMEKKDYICVSITEIENFMLLKFQNLRILIIKNYLCKIQLSFMSL